MPPPPSELFRKFIRFGCVRHPLGTPSPSKTDEFSEKFQRGGGSFSIQKFILQIFAIIDDTSVMNFGKKLQYDLLKMMGGGGGSKAVWNFSENSSVLEGVSFPKGSNPLRKVANLWTMLSRFHGKYFCN